MKQRNMQRSAEVDNRRLACISSELQEAVVVGENRLLDDADAKLQTPAGRATLGALKAQVRQVAQNCP